MGLEKKLAKTHTLTIHTDGLRESTAKRYPDAGRDGSSRVVSSLNLRCAVMIDLTIVW